MRLNKTRELYSLTLNDGAYIMQKTLATQRNQTHSLA